MKRNVLRWGILSVLVVCLFAGCGNTQSQVEKTTLTVSAAASLTDVLTELAEQYQTENENVQIDFTFGGSGALQTQIEEGATSDIFFSAAESNMEALAEQNLIDTDTRKDVLENKIVLVVPKDGNTETSFANIAQTNNIIALGEAESVPAGKYAKEIFIKMGIWKDVQSKAVFASNVREVLSWVEAGEADCGVVYATDATTSEGVQVVEEVPAEYAPDVRYPAAVVSDSQNKEQAKAFLDFLTNEKAAEAFARYGFTYIAESGV